MSLGGTLYLNVVSILDHARRVLHTHIKAQFDYTQEASVVMGSKEAIVASFIKSAPPGEVGRTLATHWHVES